MLPGWPGALVSFQSAYDILEEFRRKTRPAALWEYRSWLMEIIQ